MIAGGFEQGLADLEGMPETIAARVGLLPAARWEERVFEGEGGWNRRQLLAHLASINLRHTPRLREAAGLAGADDSASGLSLPIDEWNAVQVEARAGRSVDDLLAELRANRRDLVALVRSLTPEQRERVRLPIRGRGLTLAEWIPFILEHDRTHLAELAG